MQITVIDVGAPNTHAAKNGRTYQSLEVTYKNDQGQAQSKKLMSFSNPQVFKAAQTWEKGTQVNVTTEKDANGYWQWTGLGGDATVADNKPAASSNNSTRVTMKLRKNGLLDRCILFVKVQSLLLLISLKIVNLQLRECLESLNNLKNTSLQRKKV